MFWHHAGACVFTALLVVAAAATPLKYLSYYTADFVKYGGNITNLGSANLAPPLNNDLVAAAVFRDTHGLPSMITPGAGPDPRLLMPALLS